jgi:hypothetical protein
MLQIKCLSGLCEAKVKNAMAAGKPKDFDEWILRVQGPGIADIFMRPYNFKVQSYACNQPGPACVLLLCDGDRTYHQRASDAGAPDDMCMAHRSFRSADQYQI